MIYLRLKLTTNFAHCKQSSSWKQKSSQNCFNLFIRSSESQIHCFYQKIGIENLLTLSLYELAHWPVVLSRDAGIFRSSVGRWFTVLHRGPARAQPKHTIRERGGFSIIAKKSRAKHSAPAQPVQVRLRWALSESQWVRVTVLPVGRKFGQIKCRIEVKILDKDCCPRNYLSYGRRFCTAATWKGYYLFKNKF